MSNEIPEEEKNEMAEIPDKSQISKGFADA